MEKKTVYLNEYQGKDENHGLSSDTPVLTSGRALEIALKEGIQVFGVKGSAAYKRKIGQMVDGE